MGHLKLESPGTALITESLARRMFPAANPLGKNVLIDHPLYQAELRVVGVLDDPPRQTDRSLGFSLLTSTYPDSVIAKESAWNRWPSALPVGSLLTYVLLREGASAASVKAKLANIGASQGRDDLHYTLQPFSEMHLYTRRDFGIDEGNGGDIDASFQLLYLGMLVLGIASANYGGFFLAQYRERLKEFTLRRSVGARGWDTVLQVLSESSFLTCISFLLSILIVWIVLNTQDLVPRALLSDQWQVLVVCLILGVPLVGIGAGLYPSLSALALSRASLRNQELHSTGKSGRRVYTALLILQIASFSGLLLAGVTVNDQIAHMLDRELGFKKENVVVLSLPEDLKIMAKQHVLVDKLKQLSAITKVTGSTALPGSIHIQEFRDVGALGSLPDAFRINWVGIDPHFLDTFEIKLLEGRLPEFARAVNRNLDGELEFSVLLNKAASSLLFGPGAVAVGKRAYSSLHGQRIWWSIEGIVDDFNNRPLRESVVPLILQYPSFPREISLRVTPGNMLSMIEDIRSTWEKTFPSHAVDIAEYDQILKRAYRAENELLDVLSIASAFAVLLGGISLVTFSLQEFRRKQKGIAVRRVMGATRGSILLTEGKHIALPLLGGVSLGIAIGSVFISRWLDNFASRIILGIEDYALVGVLIVGVGLSIAVLCSLKESTRDPVVVLRAE